jgi:chromosome segregation protein
LREELNRAEIQIAKLEGEAENIAGRIGEEYSLSLNEVLNAPHEVAAMSKAKEEITSLRETLHALEPVNLLAIEELEKTKERMGAIEKGYLDLISSRENLKSLIFELDKRAKENFLLAVEVVGRNFSEIFAGLFTGGEAEIRLTGEEEVLKSGIEIYARPSGRKMLALSALSGGEKALTAIALLFALLRTHPTPFCFLDEVDAPLDDANVHRFAKLLADFSAQMQIVVITHNKNTMTAADIIYGVTMEEPGVSKIVSMKLSQVPA